MNLSLISPFKRLYKKIAWIEVDTTVGNFVIEPEHAPMILVLEKDSFVNYCLLSGKQERVKVASGMVHIKRDSVSVVGDL